LLSATRDAMRTSRLCTLGALKADVYLGLLGMSFFSFGIIGARPYESGLEARWIDHAAGCRDSASLANKSRLQTGTTYLYLT